MWGWLNVSSLGCLPYYSPGDALRDRERDDIIDMRYNVFGN